LKKIWYNKIMSAINFPDTPDDNDEFTSGGRTWRWNETSGVWEAVSATDDSINTGKAIAMAIVFGG
jgi:hypothetical protein